MRNVMLVLYLLGLLSCTDREITTEKSPNILFIFADDMTYTAINALGNKEIRTPNLNRLVNEGTTFTHAFNMGGWQPAICMASRAMIISGRSLWDASQHRAQWEAGKGYEETWAKLLEDRGYETYFSGKWHINAPSDSLFQTIAHERPGMPQDAWIERRMKQSGKVSETDEPESVKGLPGYDRPLSENDTTWSPTDPQFGGYWEGGTHWSEVLRNDAIDFLASSKKSEAPFFMYLAFNAPHDPRQSPQEFMDMYPLENISLPDSFQPKYPYAEGMESGPGMRDEDLAPFPRTEYAVRKHKQEYYALISHMDHQIGILLDSLEQTGQNENTYVVFTADHGLAVGRHGLLGKQNMFDHSIRVPFVITGPDIPKGKRVNSDIYLQDAMPTSLELAGVQKPEYVFFNSILKLAKDDGSEGNESENVGSGSAYSGLGIYGAYTDAQRMIRKDGFKLIVYPKIDKLLLFDLQADPAETNNLADRPEHGQRVKKMYADLQELQKSFNDTLVMKAIDTY